ncbi:hypothetical protein WY13_01380 [Clostridium ljungdahlii]|uniref:Uncharacterized protein n=1 Tax=Clostridium ljungdahlii TaxID=1538 RepID=A0A162L9B8_9CLOT|nr:hypothetical protein WY13_01380 [Clostridium ljungdahlii]
MKKYMLINFSNLVICQDSFLKDFDMFSLKKGTQNRRSNF